MKKLDATQLELLRKGAEEEKKIRENPELCPWCKGTGVRQFEVGPASTKSWEEPCGCRADITCEKILAGHMKKYVANKTNNQGNVKTGYEQILFCDSAEEAEKEYRYWLECGGEIGPADLIEIIEN